METVLVNFMVRYVPTIRMNHRFTYRVMLLLLQWWCPCNMSIETQVPINQWPFDLHSNATISSINDHFSDKTRNNAIHMLQIGNTPLKTLGNRYVIMINTRYTTVTCYVYIHNSAIGHCLTQRDSQNMTCDNYADNHKATNSFAINSFHLIF